MVLLFTRCVKTTGGRTNTGSCQSRDDNRSNSYVHCRIGIPPTVYLTHYIFACQYLCVKYSDGGTPMRKCTWLLLLLSPPDCDIFYCCLVGQWRIHL